MDQTTHANGLPIQVMVYLDERTVERALDRPPGFFRWIPSLQRAYQAGMDAASTGAGADTCPVRDKDKLSGTYRRGRSYRRAWMRGYQQALAEPTRIDDATRAGQQTPDEDTSQ